MVMLSMLCNALRKTVSKGQLRPVSCKAGKQASWENDTPVYNDT